MKKVLEDIMESVEEALGEWAPVSEVYCPEWAQALKDAQGKIIEAVQKLENTPENKSLERLWSDFIAWDAGQGKGGADDEAERFAKYKGAVDYQTIAFMAFVEGRNEKKAEQNENNS
jgi:hypothetical protein